MSTRVFKVTDYGVVPGKEELQTEALQRVFDMCKDEGGTVVIPSGKYRTGGLRMWSDTTLLLESGVYLLGSDICEDYPVFEVPEGVELRTDMELIPNYYNDKPWEEYRRAIISVYGGKNISIIGEPDSVIDGDDCADPNGEEGYRGPHGIFITNVNNLLLEGYTIQHFGNFAHQIDNCTNVTARGLKCYGGSDGFHLHFCRNTLIEDCIIHTGDDCIGGINVEGLVVRNCNINTSCDAFRMGGSHILVENCHIWGPGSYPHRMTVVQNRYTEAVRRKDNTLPREAGRHNMVRIWLHFASEVFPSEEPYHDITFRNCIIENSDIFLTYQPNEILQRGAELKEMFLDNVKIMGVKNMFDVSCPSDRRPVITILP